MPRFLALLLPLLWGLSCVASAQVYKSTDAEGNVVFSDTPTQGGEEIKVPEANVADPVEVPAYVPPPQPVPEVVVEQPPLEAISGEERKDRSGRPRRVWRPRPRPHN